MYLSTVGLSAKRKSAHALFIAQNIRLPKMHTQSGGVLCAEIKEHAIAGVPSRVSFKSYSLAHIGPRAIKLLLYPRLEWERKTKERVRFFVVQNKNKTKSHKPFFPFYIFCTINLDLRNSSVLQSEKESFFIPSSKL